MSIEAAMLFELETHLQDVMLRDQFRFRRKFEQLKRAESLHIIYYPDICEEK